MRIRTSNICACLERKSLRHVSARTELEIKPTSVSAPESKLKGKKAVSLKYLAKLPIHSMALRIIALKFDKLRKKK